MLRETQESDNTDTQEADELMMHEVVFLNEKNVLPEKYETGTKGENIWYLDNGASNHMTGDRRYFSKIDNTITGKVRFGYDSRIDIKGKGTIAFTDMNGDARKMTDVYFIPDLKSNIITLGQATEAGCDIRLRGEELTMHDQHGKLLVKEKRSRNRLYKVYMGIWSNARLYLSSSTETNRWHSRLGHINLESLKGMIQKELVLGLTNITIEKEVCGSCFLGKQARHPFPKATTYRAVEVLELLHGDLCGPISPRTSTGNRYIFVGIDDNTRYMWTILLKEKGEAFEKFKKLKEVIEKEIGKKIGTFRTDRGGEFVSKEFNSFCDLSGIRLHLTAPYTPQQNGVVERRNRTMMEMARSILKHMHMPNYLWGEAIRHSTYLLNCVATRALKEKMPYEGFGGKKPSVDHLRVFRCIAYTKIDGKLLKKLDDRARMLVHLGTEPGSKAYRLLDPQTRKIVVSRDVVFDESRGWNWSTDGAEEQSIGELVVTIGSFGNHGIDDHIEKTEQLRLEQGSGEEPLTQPLADTVDNEEMIEEETQVLRRSERQHTRPKYLEDYILLAEELVEEILMYLNNES